jgi:hypothetical protein
MTYDSIGAIISALAATVGLIYTARQIKHHTEISRAQFWLELRMMFAQHDMVHINLRPGGEWSNGNAGPCGTSDWARVEAYMGLFEHCEAMLDKKLIDLETFERIYLYRLHNIVSNKVIVEAKLKRESQHWRLFIRLLERLEIPIPER